MKRQKTSMECAMIRNMWIHRHYMLKMKHEYLTSNTPSAWKLYQAYEVHRYEIARIAQELSRERGLNPPFAHYYKALINN